MLKAILRTGLAAALLALASGAWAQVDPATAQALMKGSGAWKQMDGIAPQIRDGLASGLPQLNPKIKADEAQRIARLADEAFSAERLRTIVQDTIAQSTRPGHVAALQRWFNSPLGMALTHAEEQAAVDPRDPAVAMKEDAALLQSLPAARRTRLAKLVEVSRAAEGLTNSSINVAAAIQVGAASASLQGPAPDPAAVRKALEAQRPQMLRASREFAMASFAHVYAEVPDDQLVKYIAFLNSPAGRHFNDVLMRAFDAALVDGARELGKGIVSAKVGTSV